MWFTNTNWILRSGPMRIEGHRSDNLGFDAARLQVCLCDGVGQDVGLHWHGPPPPWHEARLLWGDVGSDGHSYEHRGQRLLWLGFGNELFGNWHRPWAPVAGNKFLVWKHYFYPLRIKKTALLPCVFRLLKFPYFLRILRSSLSRIFILHGDYNNSECNMQCLLTTLTLDTKYLLGPVAN